jgi:hypothetical protein
MRAITGRNIVRETNVQNIEELLSSFPRNRPPLTDAHEQIFAAEYRLNRQGDAVVEGLAKRLEGWMHRCVAKYSGPNPTLELGAGTLNHLEYETIIECYDIVEPFVELFSTRPLRNRLRHVYHDQSEIPLRPTYARIISIAVLEHMTSLPLELARSGLLLKPEGLFQAGIPSEGGFLWWLGWRCTTGISYWMRNHIDYGVIMRHEHVNTASEILALIHHFFGDVKLTRFPLPHKHLSLYAYIEARIPNRAECERFLRFSL